MAAANVWNRYQFHTIRLIEDQSRTEIILENCMGYGVYEGVCTIGVITPQLEPSKGGILDLVELKKLNA